MAGQIIPRGDKTWLVRVYMGRDANGKRRYHNKTVKGGKKDAERYRNKVVADQQEGTFVEPSRAMLADYLREWLDTTAKARVRERTLADYRFHVDRYIVPALGAHKLGQLQPQEVQRLYNHLSDRGLSARTVRYAHSTLRSALQQAVEWGKIARNPADLVTLPRQERTEQKVLTVEETKRLLTTAEGTRWYALWFLLATTGLRPGEALGLKWFDLEEGKLRVQRSLVRAKKTWRLEDPKTDRSRRAVVLSGSALAVLKAHRIKQAEERLKGGADYNQVLHLMFANQQGEPLDYRTTVARYFKPLLRAAKLPLIRPYDLRHSHATHLLAAGVHPKIVSERLGHSSTVMTMDVYSHVLPDMQEQAAQSVEDLLFGRM